MEYHAVKRKMKLVLHQLIGKDFYSMGMLRSRGMMDTNTYCKL